MKTLLALLLTTAGLIAADKPWPVFAFQNGVHFGKVQQRIAVLKELGYDGIGSANLNADLPLPQRLKAYDDAGLKLFSFCLLYTSPSPRDRQKSRMPSSA